MKTKNILLNKFCKVQVYNFFNCLPRNVNQTVVNNLNHQMAPEVILEIENTEQSDLWVVGTIISEVFLGYPIFNGNSELPILNSIFEVLGFPEESDL